MKLGLTRIFGAILFSLLSATTSSSTKAVTVFDDPLPIGAAVQIINPKNHICLGAESKERLEQATKLIEQDTEAAQIVVTAMLTKGWIVAVESGSTGKVVRSDEEENEYLVKIEGRAKPLWVNGEVVEKSR